MEFGTLSIIRSMRPAMIYVPDTAPPRKRSSHLLGVVHAPYIWGNYRHVRARGSGMFCSPLQRPLGKPIAQPLVKAYRRPVTEFRRPCLKRAKRRIDLERWQ
jgi:hypothetical protein